jgi:hypothetical protein
MKAFRDKRSILWAAGVVVAMIALLLAFVVAPMRSTFDSERGVRVDVPRMQNVPSEAVERMKRESNRDP